jgi:hypothetical protein
MAITREGAALTRTYRLTQRRISAIVTRKVVALWPLMDPTDQAKFAGWLLAMTDTVNAGRGLSARAAAKYYAEFRAAEGVAGTFTPAMPKPKTVSEVKAVALTALKRGSYATRPESALVLVSGAADRLARDAGRDLIVTATIDDPDCEGFARAASGHCCGFCATMASRGPVYSSYDTADFTPHDNCACTPEPVHDSNSYRWPPNSREFEAMWAENGSINAMRRAQYAAATA